MNETKNNYYIKVAFLFAFLSGLMGWAFLHYDTYLSINQFKYDREITTIYVFIFLTISGLNFVLYGLGRLFDFDIRPIIIFISFCEFLFIVGGVWFVTIFGTGDPILIFRNLCIDLYFIMLFLSRFLLIFILFFDKTKTNWMCKKKTNSHNAV